MNFGTKSVPVKVTGASQACAEWLGTRPDASCSVFEVELTRWPSLLDGGPGVGLKRRDEVIVSSDVKRPEVHIRRNEPLSIIGPEEVWIPPTVETRIAKGVDGRDCALKKEVGTVW